MLSYALMCYHIIFFYVKDIQNSLKWSSTEIETLDVET
jgi:hypothetical protein